MRLSDYPIWDDTKAWEKYNIVQYIGALYVALSDVPVGAKIDDQSRWLMIYKNGTFTNHERYQGLKIEQAAGEGGSEIPTLQRIFAKHKNTGLDIQTTDNIIPNLLLRYYTDRNFLSPNAMELTGDEYFKVHTAGDPDLYIELSDGILTALKKRLGMYSVARAEYDNWTIEANTRQSVSIPVIVDTSSDDQIVAVRIINIQNATDGGVNRDGCVLQFFITANNKKNMQVAIRNVTNTNAKIHVIVECLVGNLV